MRTKSVGWDLGCNVERVVYDVLERRGELHLPAFNKPDYSMLIACFKSMDAEVQQITVTEGGIPILCYHLQENGTWLCSPLEKENA